MKKIINGAVALAFLTMTQVSYAAAFNAPDANINLGWSIPNFGTVIGFLMKFMFFFAGLAALLYLILGAFAWVTSSGDKENVKKAQDKIQAAVIGLILLVVVLVILATLEQVVLKNSFCVGLTCTINIPSLLQ